MAVENGFFEIANFTMQSGATLPLARIAYRTHGKLNADKSNAILFPCFLGGVPEALEIWIGEGRPLDPAKYFIILPGQFGIAPSSSPSNTPPPYNGPYFPQAHIADDVIAQERMVRELFGISELQLVLGWSVGALQTYEWGVRFPAMVKRMASQTQFLFISHNKIAMEMAQQLIGVTMQEQGVSRIVAVDMESAANLANEQQAA